MPEEAFKIHGLSESFYSTSQFLDNDDFNFIKDSDLIIHNSRFDLPFINYELEINNILDLKKNNIIDTLTLAGKMCQASLLV